MNQYINMINPSGTTFGTYATSLTTFNTDAYVSFYSGDHVNFNNSYQDSVAAFAISYFYLQKNLIGNVDAFLVKYDNSINYLWSIQLSTGSTGVYPLFTTQDTQNIYGFCRSLNSTLNIINPSGITAPTIINQGPGDIFCCLFQASPTGSIGWSTQITSLAGGNIDNTGGSLRYTGSDLLMTFFYNNSLIAYNADNTIGATLAAPSPSTVSFGVA